MHDAGLAPFEHRIEEQRRLAADEAVLSTKVLVEGFVYEGQRVPLMGPRGIFELRVLLDIPLRELVQHNLWSVRAMLLRE